MLGIPPAASSVAAAPGGTCAAILDSAVRPAITCGAAASVAAASAGIGTVPSGSAIVMSTIWLIA